MTNRGAGRTLIRGAERIYTFDRQRRVLDGADVWIEGNRILAIVPDGAERGRNAGIPPFDRVIDGTGKFVLPGMINVHDHFFQNITQAVSITYGCTILDWLKYLYVLWAGLDPEAVYYAAQLSAAELLLTGCTTTADFFYLFPRRQHNLFDEEMRAVREVGMRFHGIRGCTPVLEANLAEELKGLSIDPGELLEEDSDIFQASREAIERYHDPSRFSMMRVGVGPTGTTYRRPAFMEQMKQFALAHGVQTHTHLHPRPEEQEICRTLHGISPLALLQRAGWLDGGSWVAHATEHGPDDIALLAATGTGVAPCPASNMRLGFKVAPVHRMLAAGVTVGVGVDGAGSIAAGDMIGEVRMALMVHRIQAVHPDLRPQDWLRPDRVFEMATIHGARILGRDDIGSLEAGKAADLILINPAQLGFAGAHDPLGGLVYSGFQHIVDTAIVNGVVVVKDGRLVDKAETEIIAGADRVVRRLVREASRRSGLDFEGRLLRGAGGRA